jgi:hypothetical protein
LAIFILKVNEQFHFSKADGEEQHQELTADRAYKEWLYLRTMAKFEQEQDKMLVYLLFCDKLADKKGIDREDRKKDPDWFVKIHYMEMPLNDVMVSLSSKYCSAE